MMNAPNLNNNAEESWHEISSNNNGENILPNDVTSSNNFLEEERAASSIGSGNTPKKNICIYFIFNQFYFIKVGVPRDLMLICDQFQYIRILHAYLLEAQAKVKRIQQ